MNTEENVKELVRQKYGEIALQDKETNESSCCGAGCCSTEVYNIMTDDYSKMEGYNPDADLGLGCGLPTQFAKIKPGDVVIDLGSGAGNDAFIARHETGETGKVIGIDFTPAMIDKARHNAEALGFHNVEFRQGDIEKIPVGGNYADVIVSNCVLNLVPNKDGVFKEIFRVLKTKGHFSIPTSSLKANYLNHSRKPLKCMQVVSPGRFKKRITWPSSKRMASLMSPFRKTNRSCFRMIS